MRLEEAAAHLETTIEKWSNQNPLFNLTPSPKPAQSGKGKHTGEMI